ncbi:ornithine cyclodeaminase family protein [Amycolatopsis rhabdoformis]|uniref:Ornithine cyclodeaminase family protein n=1 Tax=Amycolatopsis rhabdoformis TaxID=1448059 RepID=A0ABZ1IAX3_9PSEU|nr:ornithine cyclodeaminase family protein [Amycolatopsis rhabdoformis]WSE31604.1 ornithine cyclodeaminase family protein [Amycolatopsis rhabdoformis]
MTLDVVGLSEIEAVATRALVFDAVRGALIAHAEGRAQMPAPIAMWFPEAEGDCHVKAGFLDGATHFGVKVASGFYRNAERGLPTNSGLMLVFDASTGVPAAVLADEGWLTAWRTAAAGALVTHALTPPDVDEVAVFGTGLQARLQVEWLADLRPLSRVRVCGRRPEAVRKLCADLATAGLAAVPATPEEAAVTACVITATASTTPVAPASAFAAAHVTGIGTDLPGKAELPPALFTHATTIATDDHTQCLAHGDFGNAVRAGTIAPDADLPAGTVLRDGVPNRTGLTIADLTGVGVADAAVATAVFKQLG